MNTNKTLENMINGGIEELRMGIRENCFPFEYGLKNPYSNEGYWHYCVNDYSNDGNEIEIYAVNRIGDDADTIIIRNNDDGTQTVRIDGVIVESDEYIDIEKLLSYSADEYILDMLQGAYSIEDIWNDDGTEFLGIEICTAWGGPSLYINTADKKYYANWWMSSCEENIPENICNRINEVYLENLTIH